MKATVFRVTTDGTETVLYRFGTIPNDGAFPEGRLLLGSDDQLYGVSGGGGSSGWGTVYRISQLGVYSSLYSFLDQPDGRDPNGSLIQGPDGYLYGTTLGGGLDVDGGTLFRQCRVTAA